MAAIYPFLAGSVEVIVASLCRVTGGNERQYGGVCVIRVSDV